MSCKRIDSFPNTAIQNYEFSFRVALHCTCTLTNRKRSYMILCECCFQYNKIMIFLNFKYKYNKALETLRFKLIHKTYIQPVIRIKVSVLNSCEKSLYK